MLRIAHRGASGYEAENSIAALKKAIALNVDIIECDVQMTKDNIPIIRHDKRLDRTTNSTGYTWEYNWSEYLEEIRLHNGEAVSSLEAFCSIISKSKQKLYIDLKSFEATESVLKTCLNHMSPEQFMIGSFNAPAVKNIKLLHPGIQTVLIMEGRPYDIKSIVEYAQCDALALGFDSIDQESIDEAHDLGIKVFSWTINHPDEIERAKLMGVDAITSDYPDRI